MPFRTDEIDFEIALVTLRATDDAFSVPPCLMSRFLAEEMLAFGNYKVSGCDGSLTDRVKSLQSGPSILIE